MFTNGFLILYYFVLGIASRIPQRANFFAINRQHHPNRSGEGGDFRNGEGVPNSIHIVREGQQIGGGDEHTDLAGDGGDHAVNALAHGLKYIAEDDANTGEDKGKAQSAQSGDANLQKSLIGIEEAQQGFGE